MLEILNRYAHGYVTIPAIVHLRERGLFELLEEKPLRLDSLASTLAAVPGPFGVAVRTLESLGWCRVDEQGQVEPTPDMKQYALIPQELVDLYDIPITEEWVNEVGRDRIAQLLKASTQRWATSNERLADVIDGCALVPLLLSLRLAGSLLEDQEQLRFGETHRASASHLEAYFLSRGWGTQREGMLHLTKAGQFLSQRILNTAVVASYRPMLAQMEEMLFGDVSEVLTRDTDGTECYVDRALNVESSASQHEKFFADLQEIVLELFDGSDFHEQPKYVADMGCGNGALLKRIYEAIQGQTARGKVLEEHPLTLLAIDYNQAALEAASQTLDGLPHLVVQGDISNPEQMISDLRKCGVPDPENALHLRSFLDHDRPYQPPQNEDAVTGRRANRYSGAYTDSNGEPIEPAAVVQSLVEHLRRWSGVTSRFGLLALEVHCLSPATVQSFADESESLHYDAFHGWSGQLLVEPDVHLMAAAEAGLFVRPESFRRYPQLLPFTRITLGHFEQRPWSVRHAHPDDLPALNRLEEECWSPLLRASQTRLARRINRYPRGQFVLEYDSRVAGVIYSQRINDVSQLDGVTDASVEDLHVSDGSVVQLLAANVDPELQHLGLGDQLLSFVLQVGRAMSGVTGIAGVTRCREFHSHSSNSLEEYVKLEDPNGKPVDPILRFHCSHGANVSRVMPGYRLADTENSGAGVLIEYPVGEGLSSDRPGENKQVCRASVDVGEIVHESVRKLLGEQPDPEYRPDMPLAKLGLDSLDLVELRTVLESRLDCSIDEGIFVERPTAEAVIEYVQSTEDEESL